MANYFDVASCKQFPLKVKASILRLYNKKTKECTHLFSVFECIEPDMQIKDNHNVFDFTDKGKSEEKVYYTERVMTLNEDFISDPMSNFKIPDYEENLDQFRFINTELYHGPENGTGYLLSNGSSKSGLCKLFPDTKNPTWIKVWIDKECETVKYLKEKKKLVSQIENVSLKNLGFNILDYKDYIGSVFLVWHHNEVKSIDIEGIVKPKFGISLNLDFRTDERPSLKVEVCQVEQKDCIVNNHIEKLPRPGFRQFINLPALPDNMMVKVYDVDDNLLYHYAFNVIRQFDITLSFPSQKVSGVKVRDAKGNEKQLVPIQKWTNETDVVGGKIESMNNYFPDAEKIRNIDRNKESGQFIFFDGDKTKQEINKENALNSVIKILNKATKRCMVCDDYFDSSDFGSFLCPLKNGNVEIRVMSSLSDMDKECAMRLAHVVDQYNNVIGKECAMARMLRGNKSVLHDRFIVCDDEIWAVGASFNELGARASVIYKIPYEAGLVIIQKLEEWWNDDKVSVDVHNVPSAPKTESH